jgi:hypothetical protein
MRYVLVLTLAAACASPASDPAPAVEVLGVHVPPDDDCDPDEGLEVAPDGEVLVGISQAALCCRFELAYEAKASELGGCAPFPAAACEDRGLEDCDVALVDAWADFGFALDCEDLEAYAARPETYHAFHCGPDCELTGPSGRFECCPGTPYALRSWRRCPYWCDGLSACGRDPDCEALLAARGPRIP